MIVFCVSLRTFNVPWCTSVLLCCISRPLVTGIVDKWWSDWEKWLEIESCCKEWLTEQERLTTGKGEIESSCKTRWAYLAKCDKHLVMSRVHVKSWERREGWKLRKGGLKRREGGEGGCLCVHARACPHRGLVSYWSHLIILNHSLLPWEHLTLPLPPSLRLLQPLSASLSLSACLLFLGCFFMCPRLFLTSGVRWLHSQSTSKVKVKWG